MAERKLVSIPGTLEQIPISRAVLYKLFARGELLRVNVGARAFVPQASIDAYIERITAEAQQRITA